MAENSVKKTLIYFIAKENTACYGSIISVFTSISVAYLFSREIQERPGKSVSIVYRGGILIQTRMHANSDTHACLFIHACMVSLIQKRNAHACLNKDDIRFTSMDAIFKGS